MVALVTVLYNSDEVLEGFIKSVSQQSFKNIQLYLIDNSPSLNTDQLIENLSKKYAIDEIVHIKNENNIGIAKGNNQGIVLALERGCEYVLLLNNDIEFPNDTIEKMYSYAVQENEYIIVPKIYFFETNKIWMAGGKLSKYKGVTKHIGEGVEDSGQFNEIKHFEYAPTCFMLINSEVFEKVGLMDENYFVYFDDTDFIWRCVQCGYKVCYFPYSNVAHKVSALTGGGESLFTIYQGNKNRRYFINKNFNGLYWICSIAFFYFTRVIKYLQYNSDQKKALISALISINK